MKQSIATLIAVVLLTGSALAQQPPRNKRQANTGTGMSDTKPSNSARSTYSNNGTNPSGGTGTTLDQNSASGSATGPAGTSGPTKVDNRSSTTTGTTTKARKKPGELVNLKKNN